MDGLDAVQKVAGEEIKRYLDQNPFVEARGLICACKQIQKLKRAVWNPFNWLQLWFCRSGILKDRKVKIGECESDIALFRQNHFSVPPDHKKLIEQECRNMDFDKLLRETKSQDALKSGDKTWEGSLCRCLKDFIIRLSELDPHLFKRLSDDGEIDDLFRLMHEILERGSRGEKMESIEMWEEQSVKINRFLEKCEGVSDRGFQSQLYHLKSFLKLPVREPKTHSKAEIAIGLINTFKEHLRKHFPDVYNLPNTTDDLAELDVVIRELKSIETTAAWNLDIDRLRFATIEILNTIVYPISSSSPHYQTIADDILQITNHFREKRP